LIVFCIAGPAVGLLVWIIIAIVDKQHNYHQPTTPRNDPPATPQYPLTFEHNDRSLADKLDTRITNIFRNPWEGIL
jgi:hypothetical protein